MADQISDTRTINQLWVHAASYIEPGIQNMWAQGRPLLAFLNDERYSKVQVKRVITGGVDIRPGVEYEESPAYNFDGFQTVPLMATDPFTQGVFQWRGIIVPVGVANTEIWKTNGEKLPVGNLVKNKFNNAMASFRLRLSQEIIWGNEGTDPTTAGNTVGTGGHVDGLRYALNYQNDQADSYGGWNRSVNTWARHEIQDIGGAVFTLTSEIVSADPLLNYLDEYIIKCTQGDSGEEAQINLLVTTRTMLNYMAQRARRTPIPAQIIVRNNLIDLAIKCTEYDGIPMIWEPTMDTNLPGVVGTETGQGVYGLNTRTCRLYVNKAADTVMSDLEKVQEQQAHRADLVWYGNFAIIEPRRNFVLFGGDAPA